MVLRNLSTFVSRVQSSPIFTTVAQNVAVAVYTCKVIIFKVANNLGALFVNWAFKK